MSSRGAVDRYEDFDSDVYDRKAFRIYEDQCDRFLNADAWPEHIIVSDYGRPLSVSGRPCYILPKFFFYIFYGRLILRPWLTEVRESFTRGGPLVSLEKLVLGFFPGHP